jgi:hypothetical protein
MNAGELRARQLMEMWQPSRQAAGHAKAGDFAEPSLGVAVPNETGEAIAVGVNQPVGVGGRDELKRAD